MKPLIEELCNQSLVIKKSKLPRAFQSNFHRIASHEIHDNYLILIPSERNLEFANTIEKLYPNTFVHTNIVDMDVIGKPDIQYLFGLHYSANGIINALKNSTIIVENTPEVKQYVDSLKVASKILGQKYTALRRLNLPIKNDSLTPIASHITQRYFLSKYNIKNYRLNISNNIPVHRFNFHIPIDASEFLALDLEDQKVYRDKLTEEAVKTVEGLIKSEASVKMVSREFRIEGKFYNKLYSKTRNKLASINVSSSTWSSKVKGGDSVFIITVKRESTFKETREFIFKLLKENNNTFLHFFMKLINKG